MSIWAFSSHCLHSNSRVIYKSGPNQACLNFQYLIGYYINRNFIIIIIFIMTIISTMYTYILIPTKSIYKSMSAIWLCMLLLQCIAVGVFLHNPISHTEDKWHCGAANNLHIKLVCLLGYGWVQKQLVLRCEAPRCNLCK